MKEGAVNLVGRQISGPIKAILFSLTLATVAAPLSAQGYLSGKEANKKVVADFYRLCFEPRNVDLVHQYIAEDFIEHNPRYESGRDNFAKMLAAAPKPANDEIGLEMKNPPTFIVAEGDVVTYIFKRSTPDLKDKSKTYDRYTFDTFRIRNGKIVEHWDLATR
jgi:predicted SnoaL-like aldol condensation-catalyzing enzyme